MHRQLQQEAPEEEILEAMKMADKEQKGYVLAHELRAKLTGHGEKLTNKEGERGEGQLTGVESTDMYTHIPNICVCVCVCG